MNIFETLATSDTYIEVTVGGEMVSTPASTAMTSPSVAEIALQHCAGLFTACFADCSKIYKVIQVQSGMVASLVTLVSFAPMNCDQLIAPHSQEPVQLVLRRTARIQLHVQLTRRPSATLVKAHVHQIRTVQAFGAHARLAARWPTIACGLRMLLRVARVHRVLLRVTVAQAKGLALYSSKWR